MIRRIKGSNGTQSRRHQDLVDFIRTTGVGSNAKVLDVGCGSGQLAKLMRNSGFGDIHGADWNAPASVVLESFSSYKQIDLNEELLEDHIESKFDLIVCSDTLEHLERPARVLRSMQHLLKESGSIYVTIPNCANLFQRISWLLTGNSFRYRTEKPGEFGHISLFPSHVMTTLLNRAGLECVDKGKGYAAIAGFITTNGIKLSDFWSYACYYQLKPARKGPDAV